jgi:hypothetical protein
MSFFREFVEFLIARKKYWLIPLFLMMAAIGSIFVLAKGSAIAPFIYTLF